MNSEGKKAKTLKKHIYRPDPTLAELAANDNTTTTIVRLWKTLPAPDRSALGLILASEAIRVRVSAANLEEVIAEQPIEKRRRLRDRHFSRAALRQSMLDERDACLRVLSDTLPPQPSGYAMAKQIAAELDHYQKDGSWRFDRNRAPPEDPKKAAMWRILTLDNETIRSRSVIEKALAGSRSKSRR